MLGKLFILAKPQCFLTDGTIYNLSHVCVLKIPYLKSIHTFIVTTTKTAFLESLKFRFVIFNQSWFGDTLRNISHLKTGCVVFSIECN